jgi:hypothetical protein
MSIRRILSVITLVLALAGVMPTAGVHAAAKEKYQKTVEKYVIPQLKKGDYGGFHIHDLHNDLPRAFCRVFQLPKESRPGRYGCSSGVDFDRSGK